MSHQPMSSFTTFTTQNITVATTKPFDVVIATLDNIIDRKGEKPWGRVRRQTLPLHEFERMSGSKVDHSGDSRKSLAYVFECRLFGKMVRSIPSQLCVAGREGESGAVIHYSLAARTASMDCEDTRRAAAALDGALVSLLKNVASR